MIKKKGKTIFKYMLHSQILVPCILRSVINPEILCHYGKLSKLYFNVPLSSNSREKLLYSIAILYDTGQHFNAAPQHLKTIVHWNIVLTISGLMEKCWNYISMHHCSPIAGRLTLICMEPGSEIATSSAYRWYNI